MSADVFLTVDFSRQAVKKSKTQKNIVANVIFTNNIYHKTNKVAGKAPYFRTGDK
jgi:hypothetical protein